MKEIFQPVCDPILIRIGVPAAYSWISALGRREIDGLPLGECRRLRNNRDGVEDEVSVQILPDGIRELNRRQIRVGDEGVMIMLERHENGVKRERVWRSYDGV